MQPQQPTAVNGRATKEQKLDFVQKTLDHFLRDNTTFLAMEPVKQRQLYSELLHNGYDALEQGRLAPVRALGDDGGVGSVDKAVGIRDAAGVMGSLEQSVDFPKFVKDLVTGVYGSIVASTIEQMQAYVEFFKQLSKPLGAIAREIDDVDAMSEVTANDPEKFSMTTNDSGQTNLVDNDSGMTMDTTNSEVQEVLMQAKLSMARERRLLLREALLMGVSRLVVDKGTIKAGVLFDIQATEKGRQRAQSTDINRSDTNFGGGIPIFGGGHRSQDTKITVQTRSLDTTSQLHANMTGHVEVIFRSDVFKLDNFASMFADNDLKQVIAQRSGQQQQPGAPGTPGALAPGQAAAPPAAGVATAPPAGAVVTPAATPTG